MTFISSCDLSSLSLAGTVATRRTTASQDSSPTPSTKSGHTVHFLEFAFLHHKEFIARGEFEREWLGGTEKKNTPTTRGGSLADGQAYFLDVFLKLKLTGVGLTLISFTS